MILLEEFLEKIYGTETKDSPSVWIYDGMGCQVENGSVDELFVIFKSGYIPEISLSEDLLKKQVAGIMRTDYGIAVCVEDVEED